jgi:hypothetical protein
MFIRIREVKSEFKQRADGIAKRMCAGKCEGRFRARRDAHGGLVTTRTELEGCPLKPQCPLRIAGTLTPYRLTISLVENRRANGKVRQQHVAHLGSILGEDLPAFWDRADPPGRGAASNKWSFWRRHWFWENVDQRLARLANRVGPDMEAIRQAIAKRVPPVSEEEWQFLDTMSWDWLEKNWQSLVDRDEKSIVEAEENIRRLRARIAKAGKPNVELVKQLRASGKKYDETPAALELNNIYGASILNR